MTGKGSVAVAPRIGKTARLEYLHRIVRLEKHDQQDCCHQQQDDHACDNDPSLAAVCLPCVLLLDLIDDLIFIAQIIDAVHTGLVCVTRQCLIQMCAVHFHPLSITPLCLPVL